jgi:hypothetical protein
MPADIPLWGMLAQARIWGKFKNTIKTYTYDCSDRSASVLGYKKRRPSGAF